MKKIKKNSHQTNYIITMTFVIVMVLPSFTSAYVLTGAQLLELVVSRLGKARNTVIQQKHVVYDDQIDGGTAELEEKVYYIFSKAFRSDLKFQNALKTHVASDETAVSIIDGKVVSEYENGFDHVKDLFLFKDRIMLQKRLNRLGLDTDFTRITRYNDRIVYVIGRQSEYGETYPELYIDKKMRLPVKWVLRGNRFKGEETKPLEVIFHDWKKYRRLRLPGRVEFYRNNVLVREVIIDKVMINKKLKDEMFDVEKLKAKLSESDKTTSAEKKNENKSEATKTIEGLNRIIENDQLAF